MSSASFRRRASPARPSDVPRLPPSLSPHTTAGNSLYSALNEERKEIRLLRILPKTEGSWVIHCRLETHSLQDFTQEYNGLLNDETWRTKSKTEVRQQWTAIHLSAKLANLKPLKRINSTQPTDSLHRFTWGDFAALSYVWGDKSLQKTIFVNGQKMFVTANLETALREFRDAGEFSYDFKLWVDALCINQEDLEERAKQVKLMRSIYESAWSVIAWLGKESSNSHAAIQFVRDLAEIKESGGIDQLEEALRADPHFYGAGHWIALQELMDRPYWFRLWIIQEIIMGGVAAWIRCGNATIDWVTFCTGITVLQEHLWLVKDGCLELDAMTMKKDELPIWRTTSLHLVYQDLATLSRRFDKGGEHFSFERLLDLANSSRCSDNKDKVYALIGLMAPSIAQRVSPNYNLSASKVYTETAKAFIQAHDDLEPLREGNPWGPTEGPSWAADWLWPGRIRWARPSQLIWGPAYLFSRDLDATRFTPYHASGDRKHDAKFTDDGLRLTCSGIIVDSISGLSARNVRYFDWDKGSAVHPLEWSSAYGDRGATAEAIYRTLTADRVADGGKAEARHAAILQLPSSFAVAGPQFEARGWSFLAGQEGYYFRWEFFRDTIRDFPLGEHVFDDFFVNEIPPEAKEYDYTEVYSCFERSSKKRRFMTTAKGYIGWAPDNIYGDEVYQTRRGDLIAIVFGCSTPLVVRPHGDQYQVIGEAYVQGLMDGEAIQALESGMHQTQVFEFC